MNNEANNEAILGKRVAFIYRANLSPFKKNDLDILARHFDVRVLHYKGLIRGFFPLLRIVIWSDLTFSWFAGDHAFLAALLAKTFRKKSIVVAGGGEAAKVPEIGYGGMRSPLVAWIVKNALKYSHRVLAVDDSLKREIINEIGMSEKNIETIPTGYDPEKFRASGIKEKLVLTVAHINTWNRVRLKGLDIFVKSAELLPSVKFAIVGLYGEGLEKLRSIAPPNIEFVEPLPQDELIAYYQKGKVYCQLSMREGLPNALCEAMLCECVPVGTHKFGIPTAIGNTGFYVPYGDAEATVEAIKEALNSDKGKEARQRIKNVFPIERRGKELTQVIGVLLNEK